MKMEQTECSETLAYKIQTPGNYPEENVQHSWGNLWVAVQELLLISQERLLHAFSWCFYEGLQQSSIS